jgi:beta-galactosidase
MDWLLSLVCAAAGLRAPLDAPEGVEVVRRGAGGQAHLFLLNHKSRPVAISLPNPRKDILTGRTYDGELTLPGYGVAVLVEA